MKHTLLSIAIAASLISVKTHAVAYGEDVLASEYQDHTVRFQVFHPSGGGDKNQTTCGGLLIAGQYILTAGHCIGTRINLEDDENKRYDWYIDNGAKNAITVFQGIEVNTPNRTTLNYSVIDIATTSADHDVIDATWHEEYEFVKDQHPEFNWGQLDHLLSSYAARAKSWPKTNRHQDIGLIKLEKPISQVTHAAIVAAFDPIEKTFRVSDEQRFTFKGWGRTDKHPLPPTTMQKTELIWRYTGGTEEFGGTGKWVNDSTYAPNFAKQWTGGVPPVASCTDNTHNCFYGLDDYVPLFPTRKASLPLQGDSGTPLMLNSSQAIAFAKRTHAKVIPEFVEFTHVGHYIPLLIKRIDKLAAPAMMNYAFDVTMDEKDAPSTDFPILLSEIGKAPVSTTFTIQNLTNETQLINPFLQGESQYVTLTGCENETLKPSQFCEMRVQIDGESNAVLNFGDNRNTTTTIGLDINIDIIPEDDHGGGEGSVDNNTSKPSNNGSSGGGSMSFLSLLFMLAMRGFRRQR
ncbi:trypsin-like serine protease [Vibrio metschnikovii]|nr:trypsin-like serine protease [Vibrio metschnikovii]EKO3895552.1 trypsin-like serine protease [Vibrio metschnikovii]EKO3925647.1 trypsin-like serine protease [Vibrio metschnikovii]